MKYIELRNQIKDLGFEEEAIFTEYPSLFRNAITRACQLIATLVKAPVGSIHLDLTNELGTTTSNISEGSKTNPVVIGDELVTASKFDIVSVAKVSNGTSKEEHYYYDGSAWQVLGRYDLAELSKDENGNVLFDRIERIVVNDGSVGKTFLSYDLEQDHILVMSQSVRADLTLFYYERIIPVTESTQNDFEVQVVYPCEPLVALLAAHYVWLDDDERKAVMYWNEFDQLRQEIEARAFRPKARIVGGI